MKLTILGSYSATPHVNKAPTAQLLEIRGHRFLIDCGEGTQVRLRQHKIKFSHIKHIFISHLHGDHFYGLPGLISTFRLLGREAPLHIYGPKGIKEAIRMLLKLADSWTNYALHFHELDQDDSVLLYSDDQVEVTTIPLKHRIYTNGFLFKELPGLRKINKINTDKYQIDISQFHKLKLGEDIKDDQGLTIPNSELTFNPSPTRSYAFCSDTAYFPELADAVHGVDVMYHESTFLEDRKDLALKTYHSTAKQAAMIAKQAQIGQLLLGHFSSRYKSLEPFLQEAQTVFENVQLASDGMVYDFE
jgi:ribonuclease Z